MLNVGCKDCLADTTIAAVKSVNDARAPVHLSSCLFGRDDFVVWLCDDHFPVRSTHEYAGPNKGGLTQGAVVHHSFVMSSQDIHFLLMFCQRGREVMELTAIF